MRLPTRTGLGESGKPVAGVAQIHSSWLTEYTGLGWEPQGGARSLSPVHAHCGPVGHSAKDHSADKLLCAQIPPTGRLSSTRQLVCGVICKTHLRLLEDSLGHRGADLTSEGAQAEKNHEGPQ